MSKLEELFKLELAILQEKRAAATAAEAERLAMMPKSPDRIDLEKVLSLLTSAEGFLSAKGFSIEDQNDAIVLRAKEREISVSRNNQKYQVSLLAYLKGTPSKAKANAGVGTVPVIVMPIDPEDSDWVEAPEAVIELVARFLAKVSAENNNA